ncbi:hypothetical protein VTH06DRAFT_7211 [Thermothelomyces fergusii]
METGARAAPLTLPIRTKKAARAGDKDKPGSDKGGIARLATVFHPRNDPLCPEADLPPEAHFSVSRVPTAAGPRLVNLFDRREMMLAIAGSCLRNGGTDPVGGCAFVFGHDDDDDDDGGDDDDDAERDRDSHAAGLRAVAFRLSALDADPLPPPPRPPSPPPLPPLPPSHDDTCNRAGLGAAIAALRFRDWAGEGWRRVVVVTDLEYLARGATEWLPNWVRERWRMPRGGRSATRKNEGDGGGGNGNGNGNDEDDDHHENKRCRCRPNRDLWEELQARIEELAAAGCEVSFWRVDARECGRGGGGGGGGGVLALAKRAAQTVARKS